MPDKFLIVELWTGGRSLLRENGNVPAGGDAAVTVQRQGGTPEDLILTEDGA